MKENLEGVHVWNEQEPQPIAVPLLGLQAHRKANLDQSSYDFVGRESLINELLKILNATRQTKGCYLISGFRGSGKTTLINNVLALYGRGEVNSAWPPATPTIEENENRKKLSYRFKNVLSRGRRKLRACSRSSTSKFGLPILEFQTWLGIKLIWPCRIPSIIKSVINYFRRPLIIIKVNLGQDQSLVPREVLFNTATLLYRELHDKQKYVGLTSCVIIVFIGSWLINAYFGEWFFTLLH